MFTDIAGGVGCLEREYVGVFAERHGIFSVEIVPVVGGVKDGKIAHQLPRRRYSVVRSEPHRGAQFRVLNPFSGSRRRASRDESYTHLIRGKHAITIGVPTRQQLCFTEKPNTTAVPEHVCVNAPG